MKDLEPCPFTCVILAVPHDQEDKTTGNNSPPRQRTTHPTTQFIDDYMV